MELDRFGRTYLTLTLEIDKHVDGYVDSYFGPDGLRSAVRASGKQPVAALREQHAWLNQHIPTGDTQRARFLRAELRAIACTLDLIDGREIAYLDEVNRLYDIAPQAVDTAQFEAAHRALDTVLPGSGPLIDRMATWRRRLEVSAEKLPDLLERARAEVHARTAAFIDLPPNEGFRVALVSDKPWAGYNWYLGDGQSRIDINTDLPLTAPRVLTIMAHEAYPGHHTELSLKETHLLRGKGYAEIAANLLHSPMAVISEGIATMAAEMIFPDNSANEWVVAELLPQLGVEDVSADMLRDYADAARALRTISGNVAVNLHTGALTEAQAIEYIQTYGLVSAERARQSLTFIQHPLYRSYIFTYTSGYDLIAATPEEGRADLFKRLLTEQLIPTQVAAMATPANGAGPA